jgi:hypothetical protein
MVRASGQLHPTGRGFSVEGVDAEGSVPPPSVELLNVSSAGGGPCDPPAPVPIEWAHDVLTV